MSDKPENEDESDLDPWGRQPGEPSKAFAVFAIYRDMGVRRSLRLACKQFYLAEYTSYKLRHCQDWSRKWGWVNRVAAWDAHLDKESRIVQAEAVRDMNRRYANSAKAMQGKAIQGLAKLRIEDLDATDIARLLELASKLERLCHGEATEHIKQDIKSEGSITLELVEKIVVRPTKPVAAATPPVTALTAAPSAPGMPALAAAASPPAHKITVTVSDSPAPEDDFSLPDEPPPGI